MSPNFRTVLGLDLRFQVTRPLVWVLLALVAFISFGLAAGNVTIMSGDSTVGGQSKAWITSEFAVAQMLPLEAFILYLFFVTIAAGMAIPRDDELGVGALLHSTRLKATEYVWGKFGAILLTFLAVLALHVVLQASLNHLWPNENAEKYRGPFQLLNYARPALFLAVPCLVFFCGSAFAVGAITRRAIPIFVAPVVFFVVSVFFLFQWSPTWLDPGVNRALMMLEPSGFRWVNETWLKLDRGVDFYNTSPVGYDLPFLLSRAAYALVGLACVGIAERRFRASLRGEGRRSKASAASEPPREAAPAPPGVGTASLGTVGMSVRAPGPLRTIADVARFETRNLLGQPGLYLFVPLILMQTIMNLVFAVGAFDTPILLTSGIGAVHTLNSLTLLICLLLLFYTVDSLAREWSCRLSPIYYATPVRTATILVGKAVANGVIGLAILTATFAGVAVVQAIQGQVGIELRPFAIVWGLLLFPTFVLWSSFVMAAFALTRSRYATYAVGLAAFAFTGWKQTRGEVSWVGNWNLWDAVRWTDFGSVDPNGAALLMNRLFWLAVAAFLVALTVRVFPRREFDSGRILDRLRPPSLLRTGLRLSPAIVPAVVLGVALHARVSAGFQGGAAEKKDEEYRQRNLATWAEAPTPEVGGVDLHLELDPPKRHFRVRGTYDLVNADDGPMRRFPMSVGAHFEDLEWTLAGETFEPEDRAGLAVFDLPEALSPGDTVRVGFSHEGFTPRGFTKNGGGVGSFVLASGVVLRSFDTGFLPVPYFEEERGVNEDNQLEPKDWEPGFWEGRTPPGLGSGASYPVRTTIRGPEEYSYHGVGVKRSESVEDGLRTVVWETDEPVNFFNVVAGKWDVWQGEGVEIHHHPAHTYNLDEMGATLEAARRHYSEWFYPYPWRDLRLNEFPGLASYAQGFPTNITFSESIGFLTRSTTEADAVFMVTAHEAAHQWWGNLLMPGEGPGGNVLSEGMAHFSTALLFEEVKGPEGRIEFLKRIEENYGDRRRVDAEKPLAWIDGSKAGDQTATYDKGGWVFWMLHEFLGPETSRAALRDFIGRYRGGEDFPLIQDFVAVMREHAPDPLAFDEFADQWFFAVVIPEYRFSDVSVEETNLGWTVNATVRNAGTGRMPVEISAARGKRFAAETSPDSPGARAWRETRLAIVLGPGESREVELACAFEPEILTVDPDARVLMLEREAAIAPL